MTLTSLSMKPAARRSRAALAASEMLSNDPTTVLTMCTPLHRVEEPRGDLFDRRRGSAQASAVFGVGSCQSIAYSADYKNHFAGSTCICDGASGSFGRARMARS